MFMFEVPLVPAIFEVSAARVGRLEEDPPAPFLFEALLVPAIFELPAAQIGRLEDSTLSTALEIFLPCRNVDD
ncbi:MAG TPA: hypothetical protein VMZ26_09295 [Pyrinomonadaceae bacterium]|nr:hypothetical protein [Pyrinomonadaceae bacterium]